MFDETPIVVCDMFLRYMTPKQSRLYYYLRSKDTSGNGRVVISKDELYEFLKVGEKDAKKLFTTSGKLYKLLFRHINWKEHELTIYLKSQYDIAKSLGIESFKHCAFTEVHLKHVLDSPKTLGIEIGVKYHQHKTYYQLKHNEVDKKVTKKQVLPLNFSSTSDLALGVTEYNFNNDTPNALVINNDDVVSYGTSHDKLANLLNVSVSTLKRHLKNITKVKCFKQVDKVVVFLNKQLKENNYYFFFNWLNSYVKPLPNIYNNDLVFKTKRMFKTKYKKFVLSSVVS
jgi:hypothetical protein